jgi:hypothetical protein
VSRFATVCFVGVLLFGASGLSYAKLVLVGDAIVDNKAAHFVVYYKSIPRVGNPGRRAHESFSFAEVADELRRAKNNGWEIDFLRSYMENKGEIQLDGYPTDYVNRRPIKEATPSVANTKWKTRSGGNSVRMGLPTRSPVVGDFGVVFLEFKPDGRYVVTNSDYFAVKPLKGRWSQSADRVTLTSNVAGQYTYIINGDKIKLIEGGLDGVESPWLTRVR